MSTDNVKSNTVVGLVLLYTMITCTSIFNFSTTSFIGIPAYIWTNISILVFIGWIIIQRMKNDAKVCVSTLFRPLFTFVVLTYLSVVYSYNRDDTIDKVKTMTMMFLIMLCIYNYIDSHERLRLSLIAYSWSGASTALFLFVKSDSLTNRIGQIIGDTNLLGITLAFTATVAIHLFITEHKLKAIYAVHIVAISIAILLTGSRTSFLLLVLAILSNIYISAYQKKWNIGKVVFSTIIIFIVLYVMFYIIMHNEVLYHILGMRIQSFFEIMHGEESNYGETSTQVRMIYAKRAFGWFLESPIWGHGLGTFHSYNVTCTPYGRNCFSHCDYTEILSALGVLGFFAYFTPFFKIVKSLFKSADNKINGQYAVLMGALAMEYLIGDLGLVMYYEKGTWILLAFLSVMYEITQQNRFSGQHEKVDYENKK